MRLLGSAALAAALTLSLAACGGSDEPSANGGGTANGGGAATSAPKAGALSLQDLAGLIDATLAAKKSFKATMSQDGTPMTLTLSTHSGNRDMAVQMPKDADGDALDLLKLKDGIYSHEDTYGKPWVKFPPNSKNPQHMLYSVTFALMENFVQDTQQKELLLAGGTLAGSAAEKVGAADTTHYTVRVDVPKAMEKVDRKAFVIGQWAMIQDIVAENQNPPKPASVTDAQADDLARKFGEAMKGKPATFEFWVDAQGVPHKYALSLPARADTSITLTFTEWGTAAITPPPADQVAVAPDDLLGGG